MKINFLQTLPEKSDIDLFVTTLFQDERPPRGLCGLIDWHLNGRISRFLLDRLYSGSFGEKLLFNGAPRLPWFRYLLIGMGSNENLTPERYKELSDLILSSIIEINCKSVCCQVPGFHRLPFEFSRAFELFLSVFERQKINIPEINIVWIEDLID